MLRRVLVVVSVAFLCACEVGPDLVGPADPHVPPVPGVNGSGNVVTESRANDSFHRVRFTGIGHLVLEQTGSPSLSVSAEDNIQPLLVSEVVDGTLTLGIAPGTNLGSVRPIEFHLTAPALDELSVTGAASVDAAGASSVVVRVADSLTARVTGASTVSYIGAPAVHADGLSGNVHPQ